MKRHILILFILVGVFMNVSAQDNEKVYLPEKGDFSVGISLNPLLNFVGNIFNGSENNAIGNIGGESSLSGLDSYEKGVTPDISIMGKYMLTNSWGVRANIGLMIGNDQYNEYVQNDEAVMQNPFDESKLVDTKNITSSGVSIMLGTEYRKGKKRIQGVFGAGLLLGFKTNKISYDYSNQMTTINQLPSTAWDDVYNEYGYRTLVAQGGNDCFLGATGSVGVEWFVAPKVALGAEVNLNIYYVFGGQRYVETEGYNSSSKKIERQCDLMSPGHNQFRFGTENLGGSLYMSFYF